MQVQTHTEAAAAAYFWLSPLAAFHNANELEIDRVIGFYQCRGQGQQRLGIDAICFFPSLQAPEAAP
jgi:hypothetical protein